MKKIISIILTLTVLFCFAGCQDNSDKPQVTEWKPSEIYTDEEIDAAIDAVCQDFRHWKGCTLESITYAGDEESAANAQWAEKYSFDQTLVLTSSFSTNGNPDNRFEKNETYDDYKWILIRKDGGEWSHITDGFY